MEIHSGAVKILIRLLSIIWLMSLSLNGYDLRSDTMALQRLKGQLKKRKSLSSTTQTE